MNEVRTALYAVAWPLDRKDGSTYGDSFRWHGEAVADDFLAVHGIGGHLVLARHLGKSATEGDGSAWGVVVGAADGDGGGGGSGDAVGQRQRVKADGGAVLGDVPCGASHVEGVGGAVHRAVGVVVVGVFCEVVLEIAGVLFPQDAKVSNPIEISIIFPIFFIFSPFLINITKILTYLLC